MLNLFTGRAVWPGYGLAFLALLFIFLIAGGEQHLKSYVALAIASLLLMLLSGWLRKRSHDRSLKLMEAVRQEARAFENLGDGVIITDAKGRIISLNPAAEQLFGYARDEVVGQTLSRIYRLDEKTRNQLEAIALKAGRRAYWSGELPFIRKNGSNGVCETTITPLLDNEGRTLGLVETAHDITRRKRSEELLRESEERLRFVTERAQVGYWHWEIALNRLEWSPLCKRLFAIPEDEELSYGRFLAALHPDDRERTDRAVRECLESKGHMDYDIEYRTVWLDGAVRWIHAKGSATFENGQPVRMAGIALDITDRRIIEAERERLLAQEQRAHAEADAARAEAQATNRAKDEFIALVSHELKNPLNSILGYARLLQSGRMNSKETAKAIDAIIRNTMSTSRLTEDLLDISRIVSGKLSLETVETELAEVIEAAVNDARPAAEAKGIEISVAILPINAEFTGDPMRLQQVVMNLLTNAIKFTPAGGWVSVTLRRECKQAEIVVSDTGQGISPELLPHIFDRFRQADDDSTKKKGLGLGLAIVRHLVELHGGTVEARSEGEGRGAAFTVRLPLAERQAGWKRIGQEDREAESSSPPPSCLFLSEGRARAGSG
jgi:PAS domain S-box-containing protein